MADRRRNSIAGGPSPSSIHPSAAGIAFPCDGAGGATELEAAIGKTPRTTTAIADEAFSLAAADGDNRIAVPQLQPPPNFGLLHYVGFLGFLQPAETAATGDGGQRRDGSRDTVSCPSPSSSQLPPLPELASDSCYRNGASDEEGGMSPGRSEEQLEEAVLCAHNGEDEEASWSERSEAGYDYEAMSPGRDDEDEDAMSLGSSEEEDGDEATSSLRPVEEEDDNYDGEEEEEEDDDEDEEEVPDICEDCGFMVASVMLLPCRHVCYCRDCFEESAGLICPVCENSIKRGHYLCGRLGKRR